MIDLAAPGIESQDEVAPRIETALKVMSPDRLVLAPDCGMKYLSRGTAFGKLGALANGAALVRSGLK